MENSAELILRLKYHYADGSRALWLLLAASELNVWFDSEAAIAAEAQ